MVLALGWHLSAAANDPCGCAACRGMHDRPTARLSLCSLPPLPDVLQAGLREASITCNGAAAGAQRPAPGQLRPAGPTQVYAQQHSPPTPHAPHHLHMTPHHHSRSIVQQQVGLSSPPFAPFLPSRWSSAVCSIATALPLTLMLTC